MPNDIGIKICGCIHAKEHKRFRGLKYWFVCHNRSCSPSWLSGKTYIMTEGNHKFYR